MYNNRSVSHASVDLAALATDLINNMAIKRSVYVRNISVYDLLYVAIA